MFVREEQVKVQKQGAQYLHVSQLMLQDIDSAGAAKRMPRINNYLRMQVTDPEC